jgi:hypothetical protein
LVLRSHGDLLPETDFLEVRCGRPQYEEIYRYLHASDVFLWPRAETENIVISSTVSQCRDSHTRRDLKEKVIRLIEDADFKQEVLRHAGHYVSENSAEKIAKKFIRLFEDILRS